MEAGTLDPTWWEYDKLQPLSMPVDWTPAHRGDRPWDQLEFHLDLGCGTVPKARLGIDRFPAPGVDLVIDLNRLIPAEVSPGGWDRRTIEHYKAMGIDAPALLEPRLPFPDNSIESIISHHCLEHIGDGFVHLMDECYRIIKPGGVFRIIVPLFPSQSAVADPDHKRYFMEGTFETFCGAPDGQHWMESFSVPYTKCRFEMVNEDISPPAEPGMMFSRNDSREMRVTLRKWDV